MSLFTAMDGSTLQALWAQYSPRYSYSHGPTGTWGTMTTRGAMAG